MGLGDELSKFIPKNFGKKKKAIAASQGTADGSGSSELAGKKDGASDKAAASTKPESQPPMPVNAPSAQAQRPDLDTKKPADAAGISDHESDEDNDGNQEYPISNHVLLKGHKKAVSALAWDSQGDILATGEHGSHMLLWDFASMDSSCQSFRTVVPFEGQQIHDLKFNRSSALLLCATGDPRAKLYDRDGRQVREFKRGDMYVMDMRRTSGHVAALTSVDWNPRVDEVFITASADSTVRIWNCETSLMKQEQVLVMKTKQRGVRVAATAVAYSHDATLIATAQQDGGLSMWASRGPYSRPTHHIADAHQMGTETSSVVFSPDGRVLATRGGDSTVKLWDIRKLTAPLAALGDLPSAGPEANVVFSPSGRELLAGAAHGGGIVVLSSQDLSHTRRIPTPFDGDAIRVHWHPRINQIAATSTAGPVSVLYSPETSIGGAKLCATRRPRHRHVDEGPASEVTGPIITPNALPLFRDEKPMSAKRRREKARADPLRSQKPAMPIYGHGRGGVIGVNETQHIMKSLIKDTLRDEDPREALLKYAAVAEEDPMFVAPAYRGTQDKPVFDDTGMADEPEMKRRK